MNEVTIKLRHGDVLRILSVMDVRLKECHDLLVDIAKNREEIPLWLSNEIEVKTRIIRALEKALQHSLDTRKQPPVDRSKLLIALECCRNGACDFCPDHSFMEMVTGCSQLAENSLAYIGYLEEQLEEAMYHDNR